MSISMKKTSRVYLLIVIAVLIAIGFALLLTAVATPNWLILQHPLRDADTLVGLFETCYKETCIAYVNLESFVLTDDLRAVIVMYMTSILLYLLGVVIILHHIIRQPEKRCHKLASGVFCFLGVFLNLSAFSIFVDANKYEYISPEFTYGYGYSSRMSAGSPALVAIATVMSIVLYCHSQIKETRVPAINGNDTPTPSLALDGEDPNKADVMTISGQMTSYDNPAMTDYSEDNPKPYLDFGMYGPIK